MCVQEVASKGRMVEDVVQALRNEEAAKLAAQRDAQAARQRVHQLEVPPSPSAAQPRFALLPRSVQHTTLTVSPQHAQSCPCFPVCSTSVPCLSSHMMIELCQLDKGSWERLWFVLFIFYCYLFAVIACTIHVFVVDGLQARLADSSGAQQTAEDVATCTSATLNSLKKKAHAYKQENKTLLTNYDDWLKTLVSQRGSIGAGYASDVSYDRL